MGGSGQTDVQTQRRRHGTFSNLTFLKQLQKLPLLVPFIYLRGLKFNNEKCPNKQMCFTGTVATYTDNAALSLILYFFHGFQIAHWLFVSVEISFQAFNGLWVLLDTVCFGQYKDFYLIESRNGIRT